MSGISRNRAAGALTPCITATIGQGADATDPVQQNDGTPVATDPDGWISQSKHTAGEPDGCGSTATSPWAYPPPV